MMHPSHVLRTLSCDLVQYLEEPVSSLEGLQSFSRASEIPVALDETLDETLSSAESAGQALQSLTDLVQNMRAAAVIVKPSTLPWGPSFAVSIAHSIGPLCKASCLHPHLQSGSKKGADLIYGNLIIRECHRFPLQLQVSCQVCPALRAI